MTDQPPDKSLGQIAYEASLVPLGLSADLNEWKTLQPIRKESWESAAQAVKDKVQETDYEQTQW